MPAGFNPHDVLEHKDAIAQPQAWLNGRTNTALDPALATLPDVLRTHRCVFLGKWHVGGHGAQGYQPADHGFETLAWFDAGASTYFETGDTTYYSWRHGWNAREKPFPAMPQEAFAIGDAGPPPYEEYLTDDLSARAAAFIRRHAGQRRRGDEARPFFLYLNHFAVHTPLEAPERTIAHFEEKPQRGALGHGNAVYAAMLKHLDDSVGRLLRVLEETGLDRNTLAVFASDNGGVDFTAPPATRNAPFKGGKATLYEGGVRVPLVFWMPGRFEGGLWCDAPVACTDFLPTLAELTGNATPGGLDGASMVPLLENPASPGKPRTLVWHYPFNEIVNHPGLGLPLTPHSAIRRGGHKLVWDWHGRLELYGVPADPFEQSDLAEALPELRDRLFHELRTWLKENVSPHYLPQPNPGYRAAEDSRSHPFRDLRGFLVPDGRP